MNTKAFALMLIVSGLCCVASGCDQPDPADAGLIESSEDAPQLAAASAYSWESLAPLPVPVRAAAVAVLGKQVYVLGGNAGFSSLTNLNQIYDLRTNTWTSGTPFIGPRDFAMSVALSGKIHLIGGAASGMLADHQVYDPATDTWENKAPLPTAVDAAGIGVADGRIYVFGGGVGSATYTDAVQIYDPETDSWSSGEPLPQARLSATTILHRGKFHVIGGQAAGISTIASHDVYDPKRNSWTTRQPIPSAVEAAGGGTISQSLCVFGGRTANASPTGDARPETYCYDSSRDTWARSSDMVTPRVEIAYVDVQQSILAIGGRTPTSFANAAVEILGR